MHAVALPYAAIFNHLTGATMATHLTLVKPGDVVIGVSATHSHPSVVSSAGLMPVRAVTRFTSYPRVQGRTAPAADELTEYKQLGLLSSASYLWMTAFGASPSLPGILGKVPSPNR